jgi:ankyrin repeat protein
VAAKSGDVNTTKRWAHCYSDRCATDDNRRDTPLILAADNGHVEVVRVLLEGGADVQRSNFRTSVALHRASSHGHLDVCRLLLDWGANVNTVGGPGSQKDTALHNAAEWGHLPVVKLLVERGANVTLKNALGWTAAEEARFYRRKSVADWLDSVSCVLKPSTVCSTVVTTPTEHSTGV